MNALRCTAAATLVLALGYAAPAGAELKPGAVLDQSNCEEAKDLLDPVILQHYKEGRFVSPIGEIKPGEYALDGDFLRASAANEGKFKIDEHGSVAEATTGRVPEYNFGAPFPKVDPKDPEVAPKVLWNYEYAYWSNGSSRLQPQLMWLEENSHGPSRAISIDTSTKVIEGNRVREPNPQQFSRLDRNFLFQPADLHGSATLGWRYKDPTKRDSVWAYVPALRRVRQVSPANRSDGVFGSEMTQDDGFNGFDGKPEDFTYRLLAVREEFMSFSPEALEGKLKWLPGKEGGWDFETPISRYGFREPGFKGLPWVPLDNTLVKRPVWVIEATPKDRYYLYGKLVLGIDRETYKVGNVIKYDWKGQPMAIFSRGISFGTSPDGHKYVNISGGGRGGAYAENLRMRRATAADPCLPGTLASLDPKLEMSLYALENLSRAGK